MRAFFSLDTASQIGCDGNKRYEKNSGRDQKDGQRGLDLRQSLRSNADAGNRCLIGKRIRKIGRHDILPGSETSARTPQIFVQVGE
jgi:hypothetical protein